MKIDRETGADVIAGALTPEQRRDILALLLGSLPAETVAQVVADLIPQEAVAPLLLPCLMDTASVAEAMTQRASELRSDRIYDSIAVNRRVERGDTLTIAGKLNGGHIFWRWDVERMLADLNPTVGRPVSQRRLAAREAARVE